MSQAAARLKGKGQKAPYVQANIDLHDKNAVEAEDRKRFEFVNGIVKEVERRKVFTKDKNAQDKIDAVITHKVIGIPIFAAVIFLVFYISQTTLRDLDCRLARSLDRDIPGLGRWTDGKCQPIAVRDPG